MAAVFALAGSAAAEDYLTARPPKRLALVVGNADYLNFADLSGAKVDAAAMQTLLHDQLGFEVTLVNDVATADAFTEHHLKPFAARIQPGDLVVFYFSGHGFGREGENFLVPTKAPLSVKPDQLWGAFLPESAIRKYLKDHAPGVVMVFMDACRTYAGIVSPTAPDYDPAAEPPPASPGPVTPAVADATEGLAEPTKVFTDEFVGFAAPPGKKALAIADGVSLYSAALLQHLGHDGWELADVRRNVIQQVRYATDPPQEPWFSGSLVSLVVMRPTTQTRADELATWKAALATGLRVAVRNYRDFNRVGPYAHAAQEWLDANPVDVNPKFSQVSPLQAELAWTAPTTTFQPSTVLDRLPEGLGVSRNLEIASTDSAPQSLSEATGDALLRLHGQARLTRDFEAPTPSGPQTLRRGVPVEITAAAGGFLKADALPFLGRESVPIVLKSQTPVEGLRIGSPYAEVILSPMEGRLASIVDTQPLLAQLDRLKAANRQVGWLAISTPKAPSAREQGLLGLRAVQVKYELQQRGVPEAKISTTEGLDVGSGVRVRIYAF